MYWSCSEDAAIILVNVQSPAILDGSRWRARAGLIPGPDAYGCQMRNETLAIATILK